MLKFVQTLLVALLFVTTAHAQSRSARAMKRYKAGLKAMKAEQYDKAILYFTEALELRPGAAVYYAIGLAHERKGQPEIARGFYKRVLELAQKKPRRVRKDVLKRTTEALARLDAEKAAAEKAAADRAAAEARGDLVVTSDVPDAVVLLGPRILGPADGQTRLSLPAGPHRLVVRAPGRPDARLDVVVRGGARMDVSVSLAPRSAGGLSTYDIAGISVAAVAGAALITGVVLTVQVSETRSDLELADATGRVTPDSRQAVADWADRAESASWAMYAIAGAGTAAALTLLLIDDAPVSAGANLTRDGGLLTVSGRW